MRNNYPNKLNQWLSAFLDESLNAYEKGRGSCEKGMIERAITSLRGIDTDFDKLFNQAEGPMLAKMFIKNNLNFFDSTKAQNIAAALKVDGITAESTPQEAARAFRKYVMDDTRKYPPTTPKKYPFLAAIFLSNFSRFSSPFYAPIFQT